MRSDYEIEIRWENGDTRAIPMYATPYQANRALTALSYALNRSEVRELVLWVKYTLKGVECKSQHSRIGYGMAEKAQPAKLKKSA